MLRSAIAFQELHRREVPACERGIGQLEILGGRGEALVAHQVLQDQAVDVRVREPRCVAIPARMGPPWAAPIES